MIGLDFNSLFELVRVFKDEQTCIGYLEELIWNGKPVSPFHPDGKVYKCANGKYKCKESGKYFNVRTNTMFDSTKISLQKWFMAIWLITSHKKGISSHQLAKDIEVTQKTAWFMLQRIRSCFGVIENNHELDNEVEADETFVGGKNKNRHADKKVENAQGRSCKDKTPVFGMVEREGKVVAKKVKSTASEHLTPEIIKTIKDSATLFTDEWVGYHSVSKLYDHMSVNHGANEYVNGNAYTNTIEGFWSLMKRGILGIYHFVSKKHLQYYVDEFVFRYNTRKFATETVRFNHLLRHVANKYLPYNELIADV